MLRSNSRYLIVSPNIEQISYQELIGAFLHEKYHMKANHSVFEALLKTAFNYQLILHFMESSSNSNVNYFSYEYESKISRAKEASADRIPAACGCLQNAFCVKAASEKSYNNIPPEYRTLKNSHPSPLKRVKWAEKIYRLRKAEEKLAIKKNITTEETEE